MWKTWKSRPALALGCALLASGCGASSGESTPFRSVADAPNLPGPESTLTDPDRPRVVPAQPSTALDPLTPTASVPGGAPAAARLLSSQDGQWISARRETLRAYYPAIGRLQARQRTKLGPQVSGRVEEILVDVGDAVTRDQVLLRLDPALFDIEVQQREADVEAARITLADARLNYERMENLWKKPDGQEPSIPKKLFDDAKTRLEASTATVRQAEEALHHARERLSECVIRAPYDGVVTERLVDVGESVNSAPVTHLVEVAEVGTLELEFALPQGLLSRVRPGTPVLFQAEGIAGGEEPGRVDVVFPMVDEATRTFRCRVLVDNGSSRYLPGLLVKVRVVEQELEDALCVPRASLLRTDGALAVLVRNGGAPERRPVQVALESEDHVAVAAGLAEGDEVWVPGEVGS